MNKEKLPEDVYRELLELGKKAMKWLNELMEIDEFDVKSYVINAFIDLTPVVAALAEAVGETGQDRRNPLSRRLRTS